MGAILGSQVLDGGKFFPVKVTVFSLIVVGELCGRVDAGCIGPILPPRWWTCQPQQEPIACDAGAFGVKLRSFAAAESALLASILR